MVKICVITEYDHYLENRMFTDPNCIPGNHEGNPQWLIPFGNLRTYGLSKGFQFDTYDICPPSQADFLLFWDSPSNLNKAKSLILQNPNAIPILLIIETPLFHEYIFNPNNHKMFKAVLTYNDLICDNKKYFHYFLPTSLPFQSNLNIPYLPFSDRKLVSLLNTNQYVSLWNKGRNIKNALLSGYTYNLSLFLKAEFFTGELYNERRKIVRSFHIEAPHELDLFGHKWDGFPNFKGAPSEPKLNFISKYKFHICYENCVNDCGYVSEKIIEALIAKTVPIYRGNIKIEQYIPEACFIRGEKFNNYNDMARYLKTMTEIQWQKFIDAGQEFLKSQKAHMFLPDSFAKKALVPFEKYLKNNHCT